MLVSWPSLQARVLDGSAHGEVIEHLKTLAVETEQAMSRVIEEAPDPRASDAGCFRLEVKQLTDDARFPEQTAVEPGAVCCERLLILGEHCHCECAVGRDRLVATDLLGGAPCVTKGEQK